MPKVHNLKISEEIRKKLRKSSSQMEGAFWRRVRNNQIGYKFRRQHGIGQYVVDFYCPELQLVIEIDGDSHAEKEHIEYDKAREYFFRKLNLRIIRYYNRDIVNNIEGVFEDLLARIEKLTNPIYPPLNQGEVENNLE